MSCSIDWWAGEIPKDVEESIRNFVKDNVNSAVEEFVKDVSIHISVENNELVMCLFGFDCVEIEFIFAFENKSFYFMDEQEHEIAEKLRELANKLENKK